MRRNADEIERYYKCTVKTCAKSYGSEGSLNQHYKLKHLEIYLSLPNIQAVREEAEDKENRRKFVNKARWGRMITHAYLIAHMLCDSW